jgi:hypothetical protein
MPAGLGKLESQFFAYAQLRGVTQVRAGEIARALSLTNTQEFELFKHDGAGALAASAERVLRPHHHPGRYARVHDPLTLGGYWARMGEFFHDYVWEKKASPPSTASVTRTVPR